MGDLAAAGPPNTIQPVFDTITDVDAPVWVKESFFKIGGHYAADDKINRKAMALVWHCDVLGGDERARQIAAKAAFEESVCNVCNYREFHGASNSRVWEWTRDTSEMHVHGGDGADFMDGTTEAVRTANRAHTRDGTTSIFPTTTTGSPAQLDAMLKACATVQRDWQPQDGAAESTWGCAPWVMLVFMTLGVFRPDSV